MAVTALSKLLKFSNNAINRRHTLSLAAASTEQLIRKISGEPQLSRSVSSISHLNNIVDQNSVSYGTGLVQRNNGGRLSMLPCSGIGIGQSGISKFHKRPVKKEQDDIDEDDDDSDDDISGDSGLDDVDVDDVIDCGDSSDSDEMCRNPL